MDINVQNHPHHQPGRHLDFITCVMKRFTAASSAKVTTQVVGICYDNGNLAYLPKLLNFTLSESPIVNTTAIALVVEIVMAVLILLARKS